MIIHDEESMRCLVWLSIALGPFNASPFTSACGHWDCDSPEALDSHRSKARSQDEAQVLRLQEVIPATGYIVLLLLLDPDAELELVSPSFFSAGPSRRVDNTSTVCTKVKVQTHTIRRSHQITFSAVQSGCRNYKSPQRIRR